MKSGSRTRPRRIEGNPAERMLATCATLDEAVAFFRKHYEPGFGYARILVADKTGASAMIRAKDGKLFVDPANQCRGFGYGQRTLDQMLAPSSEATVANGMKILRACIQPLGTRYSNVFDLKSGDILIFRPSETEMKLNLAAELKKGAHHYDIPQMREQLKQAPRPLAGMKRFVTEPFQAGPDPESDRPIPENARRRHQGRNASCGLRAGILEEDSGRPE